MHLAMRRAHTVRSGLRVAARAPDVVIWLSVAMLLAMTGSACSSKDKDTPVDTPTEDGGNSGGDASRDASPGPVVRLMYISTGNGQRLAVARLEADGTITRLADRDVTVGGNTGAMVYARSARRLYLGVGGSVATFSLDSGGTPAAAGTTDGTGRPVYLALARDESLLISAYFGDDRLKVHDVSGAAPHGELDTLDVADEPHAALVGPGGRVYVPHRTGNTTQWFSVDGAGDLALDDQLAAPGGAGPRHIAFTPDGRFAYVINEFADSVTAHSVAADGSLSALETVTTLPVGVDGATNTCADVHVTPDGRTLYGSNRGHDSIAMFSIGADGRLSPLGHARTEPRPREFEVSPDGRFVVVAGQDSGFVQSYSVAADGRLTAVAGAGRVEIGGDLRWVIID